MEDYFEKMLERLSKIKPKTDAEMAEYEADKRRERAVELRGESGIEMDRFSKPLIKDGRWETLRQTLVSKLGTGLMCALVGVRGNGKTQLGVEIIRAATEKGWTGYLVRSTRLMMRIKGAINSSGSPEDVIEEYIGYRVLVIDEIEKGIGTGYESQMFFELLVSRSEKGTRRDTILISNETDEEAFRSVIGDSLGSRMNANGGIIRCGWPSYR